MEAWLYRTNKLIFTAYGDIGLLLAIQSVTLILFGRGLHIKVLGTHSSGLTSFSLRVDGVLVDGIVRVLWMAAGLYKPSSIHPKHDADRFKWSLGW